MPRRWIKSLFLAFMTLLLIIFPPLLSSQGVAHEHSFMIAQQVRNTSMDQRVSEVLTAVRADYDLPAIAAAIVTSEGLVAQAAVGDRKYGTSSPVTVEDQFHLGSCTKAMTATLIGMLVEEQKLNWTSTLAELFPDVTDMHPSYRTVTIERVLMNQGGFPANDVAGISTWSLTGTPSEQRLTYVKAALTQPPAVEPGTYLYSNLGFSVAGVVAERIMGRSWEDLMRSLIFDPLGMSSAGFGPMGQPGLLNQPLQHYFSGQTRVSLEPNPEADNPDAIAPAGKVHSSMADWGKFISLHLQGEQGTSTLLKPETIQRLHTPPSNGNYAMGWVAFDREWADGTALFHNGSNTQNFAVVWIAPRRDFAVLVATNQGGGQSGTAMDVLAERLINLYVETLWTTLQSSFSASDLAIAPDGSIYVIATDDRIYRWTGSAFELFGGDDARAKTIAIAPDGSVWVTNASNEIYHWIDNSWLAVPGSATDIAVSSDGTLYVISNGSQILRWNGSEFTSISGTATRIAGGPDGTLWAVNSSNEIYTWNGSGWTQHPGEATDVSVSTNGTAYVVGTDSHLYRWNGTGFDPVDPKILAQRVAVSSNGTVWAIGMAMNVMRGRP